MSPDAIVRLRLDIAYDGTQFAGWAVQPGQRTVQGELHTAIATVLRLPSVSLTVAGRTDAGVHATGQVAHLDIPAVTWEVAARQLVRRLSGVLPSDVRVYGATEVPAQFDARFSALWRRYEYRICDREGGAEPLRRQQVLNWHPALDAAAMAAAARQLVGLHDFAAFCRRRDNATTIRALERFDVQREQHEIVCTLQADAFCHSMVRSLVGAVLAVGDGRRPVGWVATKLDQPSRAEDVRVAAACGLTLTKVAYPPDDQLAARAAQTREVRLLPPRPR
ncbi:MAG: tRNA pseudouridine(38-40) synthase TruA [Actinomycetota bacterium]|nr:tRNA pseudouridine(38-40) synthase TruA [Actinomycetota bacterium]